MNKEKMELAYSDIFGTLRISFPLRNYNNRGYFASEFLAEHIQIGAKKYCSYQVGNKSVFINIIIQKMSITGSSLSGITVNPKFIFGVNGEIRNNIFLLEDHRIVYSAGHNIVFRKFVGLL